MPNEQFPVVGVGVVVLNDDNHVLLVQRGQEPNIGMWTIPGGRQEPGETLAETAHREIEEETGVKIDRPRLIDVVDLIRRNDDDTVLRHYTLVDYAARYLAGAPRPGGDADGVLWVPVADIESHVTWSETIRIIREAVNVLNTND